MNRPQNSGDTLARVLDCLANEEDAALERLFQLLAIPSALGAAEPK